MVSFIIGIVVGIVGYWAWNKYGKGYNSYDDIKDKLDK